MMEGEPFLFLYSMVLESEPTTCDHTRRLRRRTKDKSLKPEAPTNLMSSRRHTGLLPLIRTSLLRHGWSAANFYPRMSSILDGYMNKLAMRLTDVTSGHDVYCKMFLELPLVICPTSFPHKSLNAQANHQISPTKDPKRPFVAISATG